MLALTACTAGTASATKEAGAVPQSATQTYDTWKYSFDRCMKDAGVDLSEGIPVTMSGGTAQVSGEYEKAQAGCYDKVGQPPAAPEQQTSTETEASMLAFAKCLRGLGYDYPDPVFDKGSSTSVQAFDADTIDPADVTTCMSTAYPKAADGSAENPGDGK